MTRADYPPIPSTPCWLYPFAVNKQGYARIWTGSKRDGTWSLKYAHRVAWEMAEGPIPPGMTIDHLCFTPTCVRVDHMELVTLSENVARKPQARKTHCIRGHDITDPANLRPGSKWRSCKACHRLRQGRRNDRRVGRSPRPDRPLREPATHCRQGHEWTPDNTYIRPDTGTRMCRACRGIQAPLRTDVCRNGHPRTDDNWEYRRQVDGTQARTCKTCRDESRARTKDARNVRRKEQRRAAKESGRGREDRQPPV